MMARVLDGRSVLASMPTGSTVSGECCGLLLPGAAPAAPGSFDEAPPCDRGPSRLTRRLRKIAALVR